MSEKFKVNWNSLKKTSENVLKNSADFEFSRQKFQDIINSLPLCWEGIDNDAYLKNCNAFLENLKNDTLYFNALGKFFEKGSQTYSEIVNTHAEKVKKINDSMDDEFDGIKKAG